MNSPGKGRALIFLTCLVALMAAPVLSVAQSAADTAPTAGKQAAKSAASPLTTNTANQEPEALEEIIVTGVSGSTEVTKFKASFAITTFDAKQLEQLAPISTADLLGHIPGFFTEGGTAGEASNNAHVRGIPSGTGGFKFLPLLEDGLPMFEEPDTDFMNNDVFIRADLMTKSVEGIKGGPSAIFYSNAIGGAANFITRTGTQKQEGAVKLEYGDWGHVRADSFLAGPINSNLTFAVGGFYRVSDGIRSPGYTANQGGQLRGNIVFENDNRDLRVELHAQLLNDKTIFYQNLPFSIPAVLADGTKANPVVIAGAQPLGLNLNYGTWASNPLRRGTVITQDGPLNYDLADGIHPDFKSFTFKFRKNFEGWTVEDSMRRISGSSGFNAIFAAPPASNSQFLFDREHNDIANPAYSAAQQCNLKSVYLAYYAVTAANCGDKTKLKVNNLNEFIAKYANYGSVAAVYADNNTPVNANAALSIPTLWLTKVNADMFVNDLKVHTVVDFFGKHDLTGGAYASFYNLDQDWSIAQIVTDVGPSSRPVNIVALTNSGSQVGPSLTANGFLKYSTLREIAGGQFKTYAFYLNDDWQFNDRLSFNAGVRYQKLKMETNYFSANGGQDLTPAGVIPGSTADTIADNNVVGRSGRVVTNTGNFHKTGFTVAGNYEFNHNLAVFARFGDSFRLPSPKNFWDNRAVSDPVEGVTLAEGGVKWRTSNFNIFTTLFWNKFTAVGRTYDYRDINDPACQPQPGVLQDLNQCRISRGVVRRGTQNIGAEIELGWAPNLVPGLTLNGALTYQQPKYKGGDVPSVQSVFAIDPVTGNPTLVGYKLVQLGIDGNVPRRFAKTMIDFRPSYNLQNSLHWPLTVYGSVQYFSQRYAEDDNFVIYPAYHTINVGALYQVNEQLHLQVHCENLSNDHTVTEGDNPGSGNPRSPDGTRTFGIARPLIGRTIKLSMTYEF